MIQKSLLDSLLGFNSQGWILSSASLFPKETKHACQKGRLLYFTALEDVKAVNELFFKHGELLHLVPLSFEQALSISATIPGVTGLLVLSDEPITVNHDFNPVKR